MDLGWRLHQDILGTLQARDLVITAVKDGHSYRQHGRACVWRKFRTAECTRCAVDDSVMLLCTLKNEEM